MRYKSPFHVHLSLEVVCYTFRFYYFTMAFIMRLIIFICLDFLKTGVYFVLHDLDYSFCMN